MSSQLQISAYVERCDMTFDEAIKRAARAADDATRAAMNEYTQGGVTDEDDITGFLTGCLKANLSGDIGGLQWSTHIMRHRKGSAAEEKQTGADLLIHVKIDTPEQKYSKGVLVQAKRVDKNEEMSKQAHDDLVKQCKEMEKFTTHGWVFDYGRGRMRCGSVNKIKGTASRYLYSNCDWTSYRFFLELFRCPIGDSNINSAKFTDLKRITPHVMEFKANGTDFQPEIGKPKKRHK